MPVSTDDFNRTDNTNMGANWSNPGNPTWTTGGFRIVSNAATWETNNDGIEIWVGTAFAADQYSQARCTVVGGVAGEGPGVCVRALGNTCYRACVSGSGFIQISKFVSGTYTNLGNIAVTWAAGDTLRLEVIGTTLRVYQNGVKQGSDVVDSSITTGSPGIAYSGGATSASVDDWIGGETVSFPATPVLDTFTGSDETPIATNWTAPIFAGDNSVRRISNAAVAAVAGGWSGAYYDLNTYGPNVEAYATITTLGASNLVWARVQDAGTGTPDAYLAKWLSGNAIQLQRVINGSATVIGSGTVVHSSGDGLGIRCVGSSIQLWTRQSGVWTMQIRVTDTNIVGAGHIGIEMNGTTPVMDDFGGGTIPILFPTTPVLDTFGGTLGNWTTPVFGDSAITISSGELASSVTGWGSGAWNTSFGQDQEVYFTIITPTSSRVSLIMRATDLTSSMDFYTVEWQATTGVYDITRYVNGAATLLKSGNRTLSSGDSIGATIIGATITLWWKPSGGSWGEVDSITDSSPVITSGQIGTSIFNNVSRTDNFGGGAYSPYAAEVLADNPVAYYRMDEASGFPQDFSGNARHTTSVSGTPTYAQAGAIATDPTSKGIRLEAGENFYLATAVTTVTDNWTIETWAKLGGGSSSNGRTVIRNATTDGWELGCNIDGTFYYENIGTGVGSNSIGALNTSEWKLIHVISRSGVIEYYINGVADTIGAGGGAPGTPSGTVQLGAAVGLDILLDEVAIYPTALSAARVAAHYAAALYDGPVFVGAGPVTEITSGSATVSKTDCTAGNAILYHLFVSGDTADFGRTNIVNIENVAGVANSMSTVRNANNRQVFFGRVMTDGTVSFDMQVGASGEDMIAQIYEFSGVSTSRTLGHVLECSATGVVSEIGLTTGTSISDSIVTTRGDNRLALNFVGIRTVQAMPDFAGETGGDWAQAVQSSGSVMTIQLQTAYKATAGTIDGGTMTLSSTYWQSMGTSLMPVLDGPQFEGAGSGTVVTTGTGTVTKTDCVAGNFLVMHVYEDQVAFELTRSNRVNIKSLNNVNNADTLYQTAVGIGSTVVGHHSLLTGRVMADGTCSWDITVGAGGADLTARIYEFSGVATGETIGDVGENVGGSANGRYRSTGNTNTTVVQADVESRAPNRLGVAFVAIQGSRSIGDFLGETTGNFVEAISEYAHATGSGATLSLQTDLMPVAQYDQGGTATITSAPWGVISLALIPEPTGLEPQTFYVYRRRSYR